MQISLKFCIEYLGISRNTLVVYNIHIKYKMFNPSMQFVQSLENVPMKIIHITTTGISEIEKRLLDLPGYIVIDDKLTPNTKLLVTYKFISTPKYIQALKWNIPIVSVRYLWDLSMNTASRLSCPQDPGYARYKLRPLEGAMFSTSNISNAVYANYFLLLGCCYKANVSIFIDFLLTKSSCSENAFKKNINSENLDSKNDFKKNINSENLDSKNDFKKNINSENLDSKNDLQTDFKYKNNFMHKINFDEKISQDKNDLVSQKNHDDFIVNSEKVIFARKYSIPLIPCDSIFTLNHSVLLKTRRYDAKILGMDGIFLNRIFYIDPAMPQKLFNSLRRHIIENEGTRISDINEKIDFLFTLDFEKFKEHKDVLFHYQYVFDCVESKSLLYPEFYRVSLQIHRRIMPDVIAVVATAERNEAAARLKTEYENKLIALGAVVKQDIDMRVSHVIRIGRTKNESVFRNSFYSKNKITKDDSASFSTLLSFKKPKESLKLDIEEHTEDKENKKSIGVKKAKITKDIIITTNIEDQMNINDNNLHNEEYKEKLSNKSDKVNLSNKSDKVNLSNKSDKVNLSNKSDKENLFNKSDKENLSNKSDKENLSNKSDNENLFNKSDNENLFNKSDNENLSNKSDKENLSNKSDNENLFNKSDKENLSNKSDKENLSNKSDKVNLSNKSDKVNLFNKSDKENSCNKINNIIDKENLSNNFNMADNFNANNSIINRTYKYSKSYNNRVNNKAQYIEVRPEWVDQCLQTLRYLKEDKFLYENSLKLFSRLPKESEPMFFQFTGLSSRRKKEMIDKLLRHGIPYSEKQQFEGCTHLVMGQITLSEKFFLGLVSGAWILREEVIDAFDNQPGFDFGQYEWAADEDMSIKEKRHARAVRKWRKRVNEEGRKPFDKWRVMFFAPEKKLASYRKLIEYGGGIITNNEDYTHIFVDKDYKGELPKTQTKIHTTDSIFTYLLK